MYNAITRGVERELLPSLKRLGIPFYAYNPLVSRRYVYSDLVDWSHLLG